jgi:hypothetical protein
MKQSLLLTLIITATVLQSCDERITPKNTPVEIVVTPPVTPPTTSTTTTTLTARSWQYNEVLLKGGGKTVAQFSRPNSIGLTTDFGITKVTYKKDGSHETELKGNINKGKWELSKDEKQLTIIDSNGGGATFDVVTISKTKLEISVTIKKVDYNDDAGWVAKVKGLGLPETSTEYTVVFSFVPI